MTSELFTCMAYAFVGAMYGWRLGCWAAGYKPVTQDEEEQNQ